jgi:hypothetical protein
MRQAFDSETRQRLWSSFLTAELAPSLQTAPFRVDSSAKLATVVNLSWSHVEVECTSTTDEAGIKTIPLLLKKK